MTWRSADHASCRRHNTGLPSDVVGAAQYGEQATICGGPGLTGSVVACV
jgi:hypothetical protein